MRTTWKKIRNKTKRGDSVELSRFFVFEWERLVKISKDQYILRSLSKIKHKKWENFIISRIVHSIIDLDIEFACQQLVRIKNRKRYLTDLCFPGLKLYLEIDEKHHSSSKQEQKDYDRKSEIWSFFFSDGVESVFLI